jgi:hypothetical protein
MTMTVSYYDESESSEEPVDERQFVDVPITPNTEIQATISDVLGTCILIVDADGTGENEEAWGAGVSESVSESNPIYSSENQIDGSSHILANVDIAQQDGVYQVSGQLISLSQNVVIICAAYRANDQFLMAVSQEFEASDEWQEIQMDIDASDVGYMKLFVLDSVGNAPLDKCIEIPVR